MMDLVWNDQYFRRTRYQVKIHKVDLSITILFASRPLLLEVHAKIQKHVTRDSGSRLGTGLLT